MEKFKKEDYKHILLMTQSCMCLNTNVSDCRLDSSPMTWVFFVLTKLELEYYLTIQM